MLEYDAAKRPSFSQLARSLRDFEAPVDRLPAFRPPSAIEAEQSGRYLECIRRRVELMEGRNNYLVGILRVFHRFEDEQSLLIPRIYKVALLYLSLSLYCLLSEDALLQLDRKSEFDIQGQSLDEIEEALTVAHRAKLAAFLEQKRERINQGKEQMREYLTRKVMGDIREAGKCAPTNPERVVLEELQVLEDVRQAKESGELGVEAFYRGALARCANNLYRTAEELEGAGGGDLACYLVVLCVSRMSLDWSPTSPPPPRCEQVVAMGRPQLLREISLWKNRV